MPLSVQYRLPRATDQYTVSQEELQHQIPPTPEQDLWNIVNGIEEHIQSINEMSHFGNGMNTQSLGFSYMQLMDGNASGQIYEPHNQVPQMSEPQKDPVLINHQDAASGTASFISL